MTMQSINVETLTPKQVIEFLDKYIIGQKQAKKSLAIVLRNRWRRQQVKTFLNFLKKDRAECKKLYYGYAKFYQTEMNKAILDKV